MLNSEKDPLVTVITVVRNGEADIEQTVLSVLSQSYKRLEYILIDGASTDRTVERASEAARSVGARIDVIVSEPDLGIYDAMNKGVALSSGQVIGILNCGDLYLPGAIEKVIAKFKTTQVDIVFGDMIILDDILGILKCVSVKVPVSVSDLNVNAVHPTVFVSRSVYDEFTFNLDFPISADKVFLSDAFLSGKKFDRINFDVAIMRTGGVSSDYFFENARLSLKKNKLDAVIAYFSRRVFLIFIQKTFRAIPKTWNRAIKVSLFGYNLIQGPVRHCSRRE